MKTITYLDSQGIELSIHKSNGNGFVIHLSDIRLDEPYDWMAYRLDLEDIDNLIKDLKAIKKQMLEDE